jgi:hypothetical protein
MNKNIFCSRKGGVTLKKPNFGDKHPFIKRPKYLPLPRTSQVLERQILRYSEKMEAREAKRKLKHEHYKSKRAESAFRGRKLMFALLGGGIRKRQTFRLNPIAAARRSMRMQFN